MSVENIFVEISLLLALSVVVAAVMRGLRQPLIIGYIIVGIIVSPYFLNLVQSTSSIATFAQLGEILLLFMVGLNLNPSIIKEVGKVSVITGLGQVIFTSLVGFLIAKALGFSTLTSWYVVVALTFSSTIIITKLLSDKGDLDTLYGRISIGFLLVQDFVAIVLLMVVSSASGGIYSTDTVLLTVMKGLTLLTALALVGMYVIPRLTRSIAKSQEFLLLFSLGFCLALAALFWKVNFSLEIGALLAGITLSTSPYRYEISSKLRPLRDFFVILFFILIGSQMTFTNLAAFTVPIIVFSLFILIGNPLIVMVLMGIMGYTKRTSFLAGLTVAQISEFSFILIALGVKVGHLNSEILSLITVIGLITIAGSTYFIMYGGKIYTKLAPFLSIFERKSAHVDENKTPTGNYDIILFGYNRVGFSLVESFRKVSRKFLVIDYNPEVVSTLTRQKIPCYYGDVTDSDLFSQLDLTSLKMAVSTIPEKEINIQLLRRLRSKKVISIVVSHQIDDAMDLYREGATYVVMPHFLGGHHTSVMIEEYGLDMKKFLKEQSLHKEHLRKRKDIGHEHPRHERH